jgi:hypothetical protein
MVMKTSIFWDVTACSLFEVNRSFEGTCSYQASYLLHAGSLLGLFFDPEDGTNMFLRNIG